MTVRKKESSLKDPLNNIVKLQDRINLFSKEIEQALSKLDLNFNGDQWIMRSYQHILTRLRDVTNALRENKWLLTGNRLPHPMTLAEMRHYPFKLASAISPEAARWRVSLSAGAGIALRPEDLKDVFDIYFRHDLYGRFRESDTIFLNRGIADPWYFAPPAGISIALNVANQENWFGYSDPLGHIATRQSVATLEGYRRHQPAITFENIAITQGATHTLTSVLTLLSRHRKGKIIIPVPNYPPLVDQISQHFRVERLALSRTYGCEPRELRRRVMESDTLGVCLPYPYNPTTDGSLYQEIAELASLCARNNRYLIVIENAYAEIPGSQLDPVEFPNTIIITSWSKSYGTAGLSIGHIVANRRMIDRFYRFASSAYGSPPSFLYLTCTTLADLELGHRLGATNRLESEVAETLSSTALLFREFSHWCEAELIHSQFNDVILDEIFNTRWFDSLEAIQSDRVAPSVNRILQTRLTGSSYDTFLKVLAAKNVSVLPADCLAPPDDRHDLRITVAVEPNQLIDGVTATCEEFDNLFAKQQADWLHPDDQLWLERAGGFNVDARLNFWGHVRRVKLRLEELARAAAFDPPAHLLRAAVLHDLGKVWSLLDPERANREWSEITGTDSAASSLPLTEGESRIAKYLLSIASQLSLPALAPELFDLLNAFFGERQRGSSLNFELNLLDLADKTSDFRLDEPVSAAGLARCLHFKSMQLKLRHPHEHDSIEQEFSQAQGRLAALFKTANPSR